MSETDYRPEIISAVGSILIGLYLVAGTLAHFAGLLSFKMWAWGFLIMLPTTAFVFWLRRQTSVSVEPTGGWE